MNRYHKVGIFLILFVSWANNYCFSQDKDKSSFYVKACVSFNLGSLVNRLGFYVDLNYVYDAVQLGYGFNGTYAFSGYGAPKSGIELMNTVKLLFAYGKYKYRNLDFVQHSYVELENSVSYNYVYYLDKRNSSQATGIISLQFNNFRFATENDLFGKSSYDRYRTGAFKFEYAYDSWRYTITSKMWTGDPRGTKHIENTDYPSKFGYRDLSDAPNGKFSHGVIAGGISYSTSLMNYSTEIGIDAERVRHIFQNQLMHDLYLLPIPAKWNKAQNPHYPMLSRTGKPYLFKDDQKIKRSKFYWSLKNDLIEFY